MKVLVGCECSGVVRRAFLARGHDAWSCDILPAVDGGEHIQGDLLEVLGRGWDLAVMHPPCTFLTASAEWAYGDGPYHQRVKPGTLVGAARREARVEAAAFFAACWGAPVARVAIENPVGCMSRLLGKPSQIVQPYEFGDDASKKTCLWLRGLPVLLETHHIAPRMVGRLPRWANQTDSGQNRLSSSEVRSAMRSVTYPGIAAAMASQWG